MSQSPLLTRRKFLASSAAFAAVCGRDSALFAESGRGNPFKAVDYMPLRKALRAFYPDECHQACRDPRQVESVKAIGLELNSWATAHPEFDALDIRRECYLSIRRHFQPFVFPELPFYFEMGVNGGWCMKSEVDVIVPGRHVNRICRRFYKEHNLIPDEAFARLDALRRNRLIVCCGPFVDDFHHIPPFHTVFTKGFRGVREEVETALASCPPDDPLGRKQLETALAGIDTIHDMQLKFKTEAERVLACGRNGDRALTLAERKNLVRIAEAAGRCPWEPPRTFYEGLNTLWFVREVFGYTDGVCNFSLGRPDAWLIDAYRREIAAGSLTVEDARDLVARFLIASDCHLDDVGWTVSRGDDQEAEMPLTLGGCDAKGCPVYNELTEMFLDAHLGCDCVYPKLHCRMSKDSPSEYLRKIGSMLMADHAVFALFNDDRHIPQFVAAGIPLERARDYIGTGCWDGNVDSWTDVDCANYVSVARIMELTLYRDSEAERDCGIAIDSIDGAGSFESFRDGVYRNFIRFYRRLLSDYTRYGRANARVFPHPVYSVCIKGGLETRRDTTDGGIAFRPREVTLAFLANVVDSMAAIRKLCFVDRTCTLTEFLSAMRSNWSGVRGEELRRMAISAPYWGDNSEETNAMMKWWIDSIHADIAGLRTDQDGPYVLATWIYREFTYWAAKMRATPDGRRDGDRLAQGFSPSEYRCTAAATTVLNAIGSLDHSKLYASNANLAFEKLAMRPEIFEAIFRVVCEKGMHLLQPNCLSVEELLDAQVHPERHRNIIVKVCGYSARFIALSKTYQDEVINRHRLK